MTNYREKDDLPEHDLTEEDSPEEGLPEDRLPERLTEEDSPEDGPNSRVPIMVGLRKWIIGALVLAIIGGLYWRLRSPTHVLGVSYVSDQSVTLWSTLAQVRQRAGEVKWGDQVEILKHSGADTLVRTSAGLEGWMDGHALIDSAAWQREVHLQSTAHAIPIQATGHTKVFTNVRLDPGRDATRIYQLTGGVALAIVGRAAVEVPAPPKGSGGASGTAQTANKDEGPKREDWLLVYPLPARPPAAPAAAATQSSTSVQTSAGGPQSAPSAGAPAASPATSPGPSSGPSAQATQGDMVMGRDPAQRQSGAPAAQAIPPLAGWVLSRYVALDLPETLRDYASTSGMRPVAWFVLNYVSDADTAEGRPQYLMAGNKGGEGQACDFNSLRVYTWGEKRRRYETAFVEGNLCGYFPIRASKQPRTGDPEFRFTALESIGAKSGGARSVAANSSSAKLERVYAMHQTSVRRVREAESIKVPVPASKSKSH